MTAPRRSPTTVYLDPQVSRAAKIKAALTGKSLSDLANEGLTRLLKEDDEDLRLVAARRKESVRSYEDVLKELRKDGLL